MFRKALDGSYMRVREFQGYLWYEGPRNEYEQKLMDEMVESRGFPNSPEFVLSSVFMRGS